MTGPRRRDIAQTTLGHGGRHQAHIDRFHETENDPWLGRKLSSYRILEKLGQGGMGTVYRAEDALGDSVAIKILSGSFGEHPEARERLIREAKIAKRIRHPNVAEFTHVGEEGNVLYMVMEYVHGNPLDSILQQGRMRWERAQPIADQICDALQAIHAHEIVHRDLKPGNILLVESTGKSDVVKLLDFGLSKSFASMQETWMQLTSDGRTMGTPAYMSPEQVEGKPLDHRSDIYTMGIILYELVSGRLPFENENPVSLAAMRLTQEPPSPRKKVPELELPDGLEAVIMRALEKDPEKRFQSVTEMKEAIRDCKSPGSVMDKNEPEEEGARSFTTTDPGANPFGDTDSTRTIESSIASRSRRWHWLGGGLVAAALLAGAFLLLKPERKLELPKRPGPVAVEKKKKAGGIEDPPSPVNPIVAPVVKLEQPKDQKMVSNKERELEDALRNGDPDDKFFKTVTNWVDNPRLHSLAVDIALRNKDAFMRLKPNENNCIGHLIMAAKYSKAEFRLLAGRYIEEYNRVHDSTKTAALEELRSDRTTVEEMYARRALMDGASWNGISDALEEYRKEHDYSEYIIVYGDFKMGLKRGGLTLEDIHTASISSDPFVRYAAKKIMEENRKDKGQKTDHPSEVDGHLDRATHDTLTPIDETFEPAKPAEAPKPETLPPKPAYDPDEALRKAFSPP